MKLVGLRINRDVIIEEIIEQVDQNYQNYVNECKFMGMGTILARHSLRHARKLSALFLQNFSKKSGEK